MKKEINFEDALKELENIVNDLEAGDVTLEKSINKFEKGMKLVTFCSKKLEEVEKENKKLKAILAIIQSQLTQKKIKK